MATLDPTDPQALPPGVTPEMAAWVQQQRQPAPAAQGFQLDPRVVEYITQKMQLPDNLGGQGLEQAQQADAQRMNLQGLGQAGERASAAIQQRAPDFTGLTPDQLNVRNFLARRGLAQEDAQRAAQIATMPIKITGDVAKVNKDMAETDKTRAEVPGAQANARKANAEAVGSEIENGPASPAMLDIARRYGVTLAPTTTNKQARETIEAEGKRQGLSIDWGKLGEEKRKTDIEEKHYQSDHPLEPVPGYRYVGPGGAPDRNSEPVKTLADKMSAAEDLKATLAKMKAIYHSVGPKGRLMGATSQDLDTLHSVLEGQIGRAMSGKGIAEYDVALANKQLPKGSDIRGALRPDLIDAAIDTLVKHADQGHAEYAKAHNFMPMRDAASAANARLVQAGVKDPNERKAILREMGF
jgi:hypothetical protein